MSTLSVVALICMVPLYGYVAAWPVRHYSVGADRFLFLVKLFMQNNPNDCLHIHPFLGQANPRFASLILVTKTPII